MKEKTVGFFRYLAYALEIILLFVLSSTPSLLPDIFGAKPTLLLCIALTAAIFEREIPAMVIGLNVGVGILLSQAFGRKDIGQMRHTFANSFYLALIIALFTTGVGLPLTVPILKLMGTPAAPLAEAASYMHINFATTIFPLLY